MTSLSKSKDLQSLENQDSEDQLEEDDAFEILCNQAEAEEMKEQRQKEVKQMRKHMDQKLEKLKANKQQAKESTLINEAQNLIEENSGLLIRKGTRKLNGEEVEAFVGGRNFLSLEELDKIMQKQGNINNKFIYTVGVIVDIGRVQMSKTGKTFCTIKVSDLNKYDIAKVKQNLAQQFKEDKEGLKMAEKSMNNNGYRVLKIMIFNELTSKIQNYHNGSIIGILNPKALKPSLEYGYTYCIDLDPQIFYIGFSDEFSVCRAVGKEGRSCQVFINKSVETLCDNDKFLQQQQQMQRFRNQRQVMTSEYIDINQLRKQHEIMLTQERIGAFGNSFGRKKSKPAPLSPKTQAKLQEQRMKKRDHFNDFMKQRELRNQKKANTQAHFKNLICQEKQHLNQSAYDNPAQTFEKKKEFPKLNKSVNETQEEEDDELEFIEGNVSTQKQSLKQMLNLNRKMLFPQRFDNEDSQKENAEVSKRIKRQ